MSTNDLEGAIKSGWVISATSPEHPEERKHRIITRYIIITACFIIAAALFYVAYNPPVIDGIKNKEIQLATFQMFTAFFYRLHQLGCW